MFISNDGSFVYPAIARSTIEAFDIHDMVKIHTDYLGWIEVYIWRVAPKYLIGE